MEDNILELFPSQQRAFWKRAVEGRRDLREIRLRAGCPVILHAGGGEYFLNSLGVLTEHRTEAVCMDRPALEAILNHICQDSFYAFEDQLKQGFLTAAGGHRVGISGQAVLDQRGEIRTIKNITFLNIRIAHQVKGAANPVLPLVYDGGELLNTLILAPPGCGKTTLLRDLIRQVSDGNRFGPGRTVGVVDERSELAGSYMGMPQNDLGIRTDVLDACPKTEGMMLLLRAMSPEVIAIDELGSREELEVLRRTAACGCRVLATVHGQSLEDLESRFDMRTGEWGKIFQIVLCLRRQSEIFLAEPLWRKGKKNVEDHGGSDDTAGMSGPGNVVSQSISGKSKKPAYFAADTGSLGERSALWKGDPGGMLPAYAEAASGALQRLV